MARDSKNISTSWKDSFDGKNGAGDRIEFDKGPGVIREEETRGEGEKVPRGWIQIQGGNCEGGVVLCNGSCDTSGDVHSDDDSVKIRQ